MNILQDRIRGSLIGGAIGDALGYPVEFINSFEGIQARYGERGITRLDTKQFWLDDEGQSGKAVVSDDTQMTLFTANGILNAKCQKIGMKHGICLAYIEWFLTQIGKKSGKHKDCWIGSLPELNKRRAPGNTCMTSSEGKKRSTTAKAVVVSCVLPPFRFMLPLTTVWTSWRRTSWLVMPQKSPISIRLGIYLQP